MLWGERNTGPNAGERTVKDDGYGGDPSAQASFERGRWGGTRPRRAARSLTDRGVSPLSCRQAKHSAAGVRSRWHSQYPMMFLITVCVNEVFHLELDYL